MKKLFDKKNTALVLGGLSILVLFLLIASLGQIHFKPAKAFTYDQSTQPIQQIIPPTWNGLVYLIVFMALVLIVVFFLLHPDQRKKFLVYFGLLCMAIIITLYILSRTGIGQPVQQQQENPGNVLITPPPGPTSAPVPQVTPSVFIPPQVSPWSSFFVGLVVILVIAGVGWWVIWSRRKTAPPYKRLAEIARSALDDIEAGKDWGDTILNSYQRMNLAVADWRGIHRKVSMTPAEFADYLTSSHLPREAIVKLTSLFERVRYGEKKPTILEIKAATECLTTILNYCQDVK